MNNEEFLKGINNLDKIIKLAEDLNIEEYHKDRILKSLKYEKEGIEYIFIKKLGIEAYNSLKEKEK